MHICWHEGDILAHKHMVEGERTHFMSVPHVEEVLRF